MAVALAAVLFWARRTPDTVVEAPPAGMPAEVSKTEAAAPPATQSATPSRPSKSSARAATLLQVVGDRYDFDPADPNGAATSLADADWLHRHGFPDADAYDRLRRASLDELEEAAKIDLRAQVILAFNMAITGRYGNRPFELLEDAAARGSIFALETWGDIHYTLKHYRNPVAGAAYYHLALRRGYFTAAGKKLIFAGTLNAEQRMLSDVYAEVAWLRLLDARKRTGTPPFAEAELRPGFEQFVATLEVAYGTPEPGTAPNP
ncbi:hypothetical protein [Arenimonas terrae]|uniref:hypothetical protein n=1 Tax=Arenimonas terrae TaxID=2546226 RepID=UPI00159EEAA5|nr:hypothetical protein [Arenimonas terrae]